METITYAFLPDGLFTLEIKTSQGTLLHATGTGLFAEASSGLAALFPSVYRIHVSGTYVIKEDVLTLHITDANLFGSHGEPVTLPNQTHDNQEVYRFKLKGDTLVLDKLDGNRPSMLTRQHGENNL